MAFIHCMMGCAMVKTPNNSIECCNYVTLFFSSLICYEYFVLFNYLCGERFRLQLQMKTVNSFSSNSVTSLRRMDYVLKRKKLIHVCGISTEIRSNSMWPLPPRKKRELQSISIGMFFAALHHVSCCVQM